MTTTFGDLFGTFANDARVATRSSSASFWPADDNTKTGAHPVLRRSRSEARWTPPTTPFDLRQVAKTHPSGIGDLTQGAPLHSAGVAQYVTDHLTQ